MWQNTTGVPNALFDTYLPELKIAELKILLVVIRQTRGWIEQGNKEKRKESDWISSSQLKEKTGCSQRAITDAIAFLVRNKLISVMDFRGAFLESPKERKSKSKLFYSLGSAIFADVDGKGKTDTEMCKTRNSSAEFAEDLRKNCFQLAQKMLCTKETLTKETSTKY